MFSRKSLFLLIVLFWLLGPSTTIHAVQYKAVDLGLLGGWTSTANDINDNGQIVGVSTNNDNRQRAFLYENGSMKDLGTLTEWNSHAYAVNNTGKVVGYDQDYYCCKFKPFLYDNDSMIDLTQNTFLSGQNGRANGINDKNQIVGELSYIGSGLRPFLYENGVFTYIAGPGSAFDINNKSQIVGFSDSHAFIYENGELTDLGTLGGVESRAEDINEVEQIVGWSEIAGGDHHAFLYENGQMKDLGTFGRDASHATGINDNGQIVGWTAENVDPQIPNFYGMEHAFLYENGVMIELETLGGELSAAYAINNLGQIVGSAQASDYRMHAVLWTPVPEPSSILLLGSGLIGLIGLRRKLT